MSTTRKRVRPSVSQSDLPMHRSLRRLGCSVLAVLLIVLVPQALVPGDAYAQGERDPSPHSEASLVSETAAVTPGESFTVALRIDLDEGWHSYWKNPGDSGQPASIDWVLPDGFSAGDFRWPFPERVGSTGLMTYAYKGEVFLLTTISPPEDLAPGDTVKLGGSASWLVCADICLPAESKVQLSLPVTEGPAPASEAADAFASTREQLPQELASWSVQAARSSGSYALALKPPAGHAPDLDDAYFYPAEKQVLDHAAPQTVTRQGDHYVLALQRSGYASEPAERLRGVLVAPEGSSWDSDGRTRAMKVDVKVDSTLSISAVSSSGTAPNDASLSLSWALLFAFAGGLLLNLMPCVFPILSVKILGFARQAGGDESVMRRHGALFGAGVLVSMWVLAALLLGLRAAGSEIGWGFQLQSPTFVALMALLFVGIGLNLLGAFEVGSRLMTWGGQVQNAAPSEGRSGAFLTGVLATVVATPCTAPFMGAALGVALTLSPVGALAIFSALGAGMAAPYVGLSMSPAWLDRLPDPGSWMETLKQFFAFPMFATSIWLAWVFGQQSGTGGIAMLLFGMLLLGMAAWVVHRWSAPSLSRRALVLSRGAVALMVAGAIAAAVIGAGSSPAPTAQAAPSADSNTPSSRWQAFASEKVERLRAQGQPVFVDFTAAWCLTCQVNERSVLSTEAVQNAFEEKNVTLIKADWTNRDPEITRALESLGRSGVPVYALYPGDGSGPKLLPEVLTQQIVIDALRDLPSARQAADARRTSSDRSPS